MNSRNKPRRDFVRAAAVLFLLFPLFAASCGFDRRHPVGLIRVGFDYWPGYQTLVIAEEKGFFAEAGREVELHQFSTLYDVRRAFGDGKLDVMFTSLHEPLLLAARGTPLKIIYVSDFSEGGDGLAVAPGVRTLGDLEGKRIALEVGSISHFILLEALEKAGLAESSVTIVNFAVADMNREFPGGACEAVVAREPFLSRLAGPDSSRILFTSRELTGRIPNVMTVSEEMYRDHPEECRALARAFARAREFLKESPREALPILARSASATDSELRRALSLARTLAPVENARLFSGDDGRLSLACTLQDYADFLFAERFIENPLRVSEFMTSEFLPAVDS